MPLSFRIVIIIASRMHVIIIKLLRDSRRHTSLFPYKYACMYLFITAKHVQCLSFFWKCVIDL